MNGPSRSTTDDDLVKVAYTSDGSEAELVQGLLRTVDVGSVVRRAPGLDVPEFLAAGPREVLVAASDVPVARDVLREVKPDQPKDSEPFQQSSSDRPRRAIAVLLLGLTVVVVFICLTTDVLI